jgi:hypothetical protein
MEGDSSGSAFRVSPYAPMFYFIADRSKKQVRQDIIPLSVFSLRKRRLWSGLFSQDFPRYYEPHNILSAFSSYNIRNYTP